MTTLSTTTEVAKALGLSRQRVLVLARQGRISGAQKTTWAWVFAPPFRIVKPSKRKKR